jgi:hypothetical protein
MRLFMLISVDYHPIPQIPQKADRHSYFPSAVNHRYCILIYNSVRRGFRNVNQQSLQSLIVKNPEKFRIQSNLQMLSFRMGQVNDLCPRNRFRQSFGLRKSTGTSSLIGHEW